MSNSTSTSITPLDQFIIGAILVVSVGLFAFLDKLLDTNFLVAILLGYGITGIAFGVYLMENSTALHSYIKYIVIIILAVISYAFTQLSQLSSWTSLLDPVIVAAFIIAVANFALNDFQDYTTYLPTSVVNDATIIIGGFVVVAEAVMNARPGTIVNVTTLLTVIVPILFAYIMQKIPWPAGTPTPAPVPTGAGTA